MAKKDADEIPQDVIEDNSLQESSLLNVDSAGELNIDKMDILRDVDMQIIVEIGRTKMKIADILSLKHGTVIELPQTVEEPLQIYASDKLIARGQIVSTQGKYFIKIM